MRPERGGVMARRRPDRPVFDDAVPPPELANGCDVTVWDPEHPYLFTWPDWASVRATLNYRTAREEWLTAHGRPLDDPIIPRGPLPYSSKESPRGSA